MATSWDAIYITHGVIQPTPSMGVKELVPFLKEHGLQRVLDHCCGTGRHVRYLAEQGFDVVGIDNSAYGISIAEQQCADLSGAELRVADMGAVPYPDRYFDAVLSVHGLQFGNKEQRSTAINEISRVLRPNGVLYLTILSDQHPLYGQGTPVPDDPHSFDNLPLHGGFRHFFSEDELHDTLSGYGILSLEHVVSKPPEGGFFKIPLHEWRVLAVKTAYLGSISGCN